MNRPQQVATKPQLALQSYLDGLLQEATEADDLTRLLERTKRSLHATTHEELNG